MNRFAWVLVGACCAAPLGAQEVKVFTPSRQSDAPLFMNGRLVRIDRAAGTITLRNDSGQSVLNVDRQTLASLGSLRPGANVILGVRVAGAGASERRLVTELRSASAVAPGSSRVTANAPETSRVTANASVVTSGSQTIGMARVMSVNPSGRRVTVVDSTGATRVLDVRGDAVASLDSLQPGDQVSLGVAAPLMNGTPAGTVNAINIATSGMQPVPSAQPIPGVQGPTGMQPVPGAQPLPGTGVTGQSAANPGLAPMTVPGTGGQTVNNGGAMGGARTSATVGNTGVAGVTGLVGTTGARGPATGATGANAATGGGVRGGGSPILGGGGVPQLGGYPVSGVNAQIPSVPPAGNASTVVLPVPSVMPQSNPPTTPAEIAAVREMATHDFDLAVAALAARAAEVDRAWAAFRSACNSSTAPLNNRSREWFGVLDGSIPAPTEDVCEQSYNEVASLAKGLEGSLDSARDTARQADVLPGRMRDVLQRYNLDI